MNKPKSLTYNLYLESPIDYSKLQNIRILTIKENLPITGALIEYISNNNIKFIEFVAGFNYPITRIPACVEHIFFPSNSKYDHPFDNLPPNLKTLIIGNGYWQSLDCLPVSLQYLGYNKSLQEFDKMYKGSIIKIEDILPIIPPNMIYLSISNGLIERLDFSSRLYNKKIIKISEYCPTNFTDLIMEQHNQDYFASCMYLDES
jgi:hypothetical protein